MAGGRPTDYSEYIADKVCDGLSNGKSLVEICRANDMPNCSTIYRWLDKHAEFCKMYTRAREEQAETLADQIIAIADETHNDIEIDDNGNARTNHEAIQRSKLRVEARKWTAAKLKPRKYGEKQHIEHSGSIDSISDDELDERIRLLNSSDS